MPEQNSNKRPSDDSSVGSASKKLNMESQVDPNKKESNKEENHLLNFKYDLEEEQWSVTNIPHTTDEGNKLMIKIGNKLDPILREEWEEMEKLCEIRSHHLDTSLIDPNSLDKWSEEIKKLHKTTRPRLKNHPSAVIAKRMMGSQINDIPKANQKDGCCRSLTTQ